MAIRNSSEALLEDWIVRSDRIITLSEKETTRDDACGA